MRIFASKYSLECKILNEYFEANIRQYEKILSKYLLCSEYSLQHVFFCMRICAAGVYLSDAPSPPRILFGVV
jgi:hypothetical protein